MSVKPVKINIKARTKDLMAEFAERLAELDGEETDETGLEDIFGDFIGEPITYETVGVMSKENGNIKISYEESDIVDEEPGSVRFVFREDIPTAVSMFKGRNVVTAFVFDSEYRRQVCLYSSEAMSFEVIICTDSLLNTVSYERGGKISVRYYIEFRGIRSEYGTLDIKIVPLKRNGAR